jgi:hypothetical protein
MEIPSVQYIPRSEQLQVSLELTKRRELRCDGSHYSGCVVSDVMFCDFH